MTRRLKSRALLLAIACVATLLPVLFVNNGLDLLTLGAAKRLGVPRIEIHVDDSCNTMIDVIATLEVTPEQSTLTIQGYPADHPLCEDRPYALITTEDITLRLPDGTVTPRGFALRTGPPILSQGTLSRDIGESSSFAVHLTGDGSKAQGRFVFAGDALGVGFGETAAQVQLATRNLRCADSNSNPATWSNPAGTNTCVIPLRGVVVYAASALDLAAALPPTYHVLTGPNLARDDDASGYYATTRLIWGGAGTSPSSHIQGALTGFEIHLLNRYSVAQRLFVTVALSAVFGTFLTMLLTLLLPDFAEKSVLVTDRSGNQAGLDHTPPALPKAGRRSEQAAGQRADDGERSGSTSASGQFSAPPILEPTSTAASTTAWPLIAVVFALTLSVAIGRCKQRLSKPKADRAVLQRSRVSPSERDEGD